jgi:hypothetical protein
MRSFARFRAIVGGLRHTRKQKKGARARILQRAMFWNIRAKKKPGDAAGLFRKLSASPFWRLGDGAIQPASILAMSGSLARRFPERVV